MVLEVADITVLPGTQEEFSAAVREGIRYVSDTPGFRNARLTRGIESPGRFVLLIEWDSVESHTKNFRESENFTAWRELVGPFFDGAPNVEHAEIAVSR